MFKTASCTLQSRKSLTMPRPLQRWPEYALGVNEDCVLKVKEIDRLQDEIQEAIIARHFYTAMKLTSRARVLCRDVMHNLKLARTGHYETEETQ